MKAVRNARPESSCASRLAPTEADNLVTTAAVPSFACDADGTLGSSFVRNTRPLSPTIGDHEAGGHARKAATPSDGCRSNRRSKDCQQHSRPYLRLATTRPAVTHASSGSASSATAAAYTPAATANSAADFALQAGRHRQVEWRQYQQLLQKQISFRDREPKFQKALEFSMCYVPCMNPRAAAVHKRLSEGRPFKSAGARLA